MVLRTHSAADLPYTTLFLFFFNDTATTEIYTLSLHDALPILRHHEVVAVVTQPDRPAHRGQRLTPPPVKTRSEEHTSELQSRSDLVCRLLLEKKKEINRALPIR